MILEVSVLDLKKNLKIEFETAFGKAQNIISGMNGYISHELQKCIENPSRNIQTTISYSGCSISIAPLSCVIVPVSLIGN